MTETEDEAKIRIIDMRTAGDGKKHWEKWREEMRAKLGEEVDIIVVFSPLTG